jgi:hypothetical protein
MDDKQKTIADVLDKSIDKLSGGAAEIAKAVKQAAPHAWEVAVRQQFAEGCVYFIAWSVVFVALLGFSVWLCRNRERIWKSAEEEYAEPFVMIGVLMLIGGMLGAGSAAARAALQVANPEYAAAMAILEAVK